MSGDNPFEVSSESYGDRSPRDRDASVAEVSVRTLDMLNQTRPWVRFLSVLLWIGTVLVGVGSVIATIAALVSGGLEMLIIGPVYLIMAIIYGFFAMYLTRYANRINALIASESVQDLEDALESQKSFWRLAGIIALLMIAFYILIIVLVVAGFAFIPSMMDP
jgi:hypothetical protein